jgi:hypothetical protein
MNEEIWKPVEQIVLKNGTVCDFEGYEVSNYGRVRTYKRKYGKVAKGTHNRPLDTKPYVINGRPDEHGYIQYCLSDINKRRKNFRAHILVMQTFVGLPDEYEVVCHFDDVKTNNKLDNLRYDTYSENVKDAIRNGRKYGRRKTSSI